MQSNLAKEKYQEPQNTLENRESSQEPIMVEENEAKAKTRRAYMNQFADDSFLSDFSDEENLNNSKNMEKITEENIVQNEYVYQKADNNPYQRPLNPFVNRELLKKTSKELLKKGNYNSRENNFNNISSHNNKSRF